MVSQDEESARLLVSKHVLNQMLVEGKDVTVEYKLFNVGERYVFLLIKFYFYSTVSVFEFFQRCIERRA